MVRPKNDLRTYVQLICGRLGSILAASVRRNMRALWQLCHGTPPQGRTA